MFIDVGEIENNLWACKKLPGQIKDENLDTKEKIEEDEHDVSNMHISIIHVAEKQEESSIPNKKHAND